MVCAWITVITFTKIYCILPMHSNVIIKNVSWPHFSWPTLYVIQSFKGSLCNGCYMSLWFCILHLAFIRCSTHEFVFTLLICLQEPYIDHSPRCVSEKFSLHRAFVMFRTLGVRHLIVTDNANRVTGIITRKDLIGGALERSLQQVLAANASAQ